MRREGWSPFEPEPRDNRGHESSNERSEEVTLTSAGVPAAHVPQ